MDAVRSAWGKQLAKARQDAGHTQQSLADLLGVTPKQVSCWERGRHVPRDENLVRLAEILGIDANDIFAFPARPKRRKAAA